VTGRWPSRDPIAERGGLNLHTMVRNNPVNAWDYLGLRVTKHGTDYRAVFESNSPSSATVSENSNVNVVMINGDAIQTSSMFGALGLTGASITIQAACSCDDSGTYKPAIVRVTLSPRIYLQDRLSNTSFPTLSQIESDEQEHVDDITDWLHSGDHGLVSLQRTIESMNTFNSSDDCKEKVIDDVILTIQPAYLTATKASNTTRHANGGHDYGPLVQ